MEKVNVRRGVLAILSGNAVAQGLPILALPFFTRLYELSDFGEFAIYFATFSILSASATLRLDNLILQYSLADDPELIGKLNCITIFFIGLLLLAACIVNLVFDLNSWVLIFAISTATIAAALSRIIHNFLLKNDCYFDCSLGRIVQALSVLLCQFLFIQVDVLNGLMLGHVIGMILGFLVFSYLGKLRLSLRFDIRYCGTFLVENREYAFLTTIGTSASNISSNFGVYFVQFLGGEIATGLYSVASRIVTGPVTIVSKSLANLVQKFVSETSKDRRIPLFYKLATGLALLYFPIFVLIIVFGEQVFEYIFGPAWTNAAALASIIVISSWARFIVNPLTGIFFIKGNHRVGLFWQLSFLLSKLIFYVIYQIGSLQDILTLSESLMVLVAVDVSLYLLAMMLMDRKLRKQKLI